MKKCLILFLMLAMLTGCAPSNVQEPEDGKLHIVATVFPAYDFARAAAGDLAEVELLLPPGTESHSYEPTPADILKVQSCDLFLYLGGESDQWVETILEAAEPQGTRIFFHCNRHLSFLFMHNFRAVQSFGEHSAAPHKAYNFHNIAVPQNALLIRAFGNDFFIPFHRNSFGAIMMLFQKLTQRNLSEIKKFPIDFDQGALLPSSRVAAPVSKLDTDQNNRE